MNTIADVVNFLVWFFRILGICCGLAAGAMFAASKLSRDGSEGGVAEGKMMGLVAASVAFFGLSVVVSSTNFNFQP